MNNKKLRQLRSDIDSIDNEILKMLAKRMKISKKIGQYKHKNNLKPLDTERWRKVLDSRIALGKSMSLPAKFIREIFTLIHRQSLSVQEERKNGDRKRKL